MQTNSLICIIAAIVSGGLLFRSRPGPMRSWGGPLGHPLWGTAVSLCVSFACILPMLRPVAPWQRSWREPSINAAVLIGV